VAASSCRLISTSEYTTELDCHSDDAEVDAMDVEGGGPGGGGGMSWKLREEPRERVSELLSSRGGWPPSLEMERERPLRPLEPKPPDRDSLKRTSCLSGWLAHRGEGPLKPRATTGFPLLSERCSLTPLADDMYSGCYSMWLDWV
jgi:hypothetical protein